MTEQALKIRLGQRLGVGFDGAVIPEEFIRLVREYKVGNVILFRRNVKSFAQLRQLCADLRTLIRAETGLEPFIMIDEECGSVSRLGHLTGTTPSAMAIGATDDPENAYRIGRTVGDQLRAAGVNFDLSPVLDCFTNPDNTVCGNRCFAREPEKVARFGARYIRGLQDAGIMACGKHFPGHGDTAVDSHLALPIVQKSMEDVRKTELVPFAAAIEAGIEAIMSTHVVFPAMEPEQVPSTVSRRVMTGLLREEMGFQGLIVSDGIEMQAVMDLFTMEDAVSRALDAGVDVVLVCHSAADAASALRAQMQRYRDGKLDEEALESHYQRIVRAKEKLPAPDRDESLFGSPSQREQNRRIMDAAIRLLHAPAGKALPAIDESTVVFGTKARRNALVNDDIPLDAAAEFARRVGGRYTGALAQGQAPRAVVFIGRHPDAEATMASARQLAEQGAQVVAVSLYTARCLDFLPDSVWKIGAWQYDDLAVDALIRWYENQRAEG